LPIGRGIAFVVVALELDGALYVVENGGLYAAGNGGLYAVGNGGLEAALGTKELLEKLAENWAWYGEGACAVACADRGGAGGG
jgi:hypothetical protein